MRKPPEFFTRFLPARGLLSIVGSSYYFEIGDTYFTPQPFRFIFVASSFITSFDTSILSDSVSDNV